MELHFTITDVPQTPAFLDLYCYLEGELVIEINGLTFFQEPLVTLVELACQLGNWLDNGFDIGIPFRFDSIDHDEPILVFEPESADSFTIESIWAEAPSQAGISAGLVKAAVTRYLKAIDQELQKRFDIPLVAIVTAMKT